LYLIVGQRTAGRRAPAVGRGAIRAALVWRARPTKRRDSDIAPGATRSARRARQRSKGISSRRTPRQPLRAQARHRTTAGSRFPPCMQLSDNRLSDATVRCDASGCNGEDPGPAQTSAGWRGRRTSSLGPARLVEPYFYAGVPVLVEVALLDFMVVLHHRAEQALQRSVSLYVERCATNGLRRACAS
jgi:hypothetical protein